MFGRIFKGLVLTALGTVALALPALAQTPTLVYPAFPLGSPGTGTPLLSCDPASNTSINTITVNGIPSGATVTATFGWFDPYATGSLATQPTLTYNNVTAGSQVIPVPYPADTEGWPGFNSITNER